MAEWAGKAVIALRMLQRELRMGPAGAMPLELDATAVLNGAVMEIVIRKQRFNAARIGMLRQWALDKAPRLENVGTGDMRSDILTKPVVPVKAVPATGATAPNRGRRGAAGRRFCVIGGDMRCRDLSPQGG